MTPSSTPEENTLPSNEASNNSTPMSDSERIERLTMENEYLSAQLAACEARLMQLSILVSDSAEDLRAYDGSFHRPSSITTITYNPPTGEIEINGNRVLRRASIPPNIWTLMEEYAREINQTNAAKRKKAGLPEPEEPLQA